MKKNYLKITCVGLLFITHTAHSQQSVNTSGGTASGAGGSSTYSIGQPFYRVSGASVTTSEGVQQPIDLTVGINEIDNVDLTMSVFPNPSYDFIHLRIDEFEQEDLRLTLVDATGKLILTQTVEHEETTISVQNLPTGTYYLEVFIAQDRFKMFTLVKH